MTESNANKVPNPVSSFSDEEEPVTEEHRAILKSQSLSENHGDIAYQLLLLQQRLEAYERLHQEEMDELRRDLDQLRRTFLETTNPQLRAIKRAPGQSEQK
jgi:hypothetical protein